MKKNNHKIFNDTYLRNVIFVLAITFVIEILFKLLNNFTIFDYSTLRIFLSTSLLSLIVVFFSSLTKRKWLRNTFLLIYILLYTIYSWLQLGFINFLGVFISFHTSSQFGAVTDYIYDFFMSFKLSYFLIFLPLIYFIILYFVVDKKREYHQIKLNKKYLLLIPTILIISLLYYGTLKLSFMQNKLQIKNNMQLFKNPDVPTVAVNQFGTVTFAIMDLRSFIFPPEELDTTFKIQNNKENENVSRQVSKYLEEIALNEGNSKFANLNNYFASQTVTDYNDYTGMFEGKNVIVILMESVNEAIINKEYFPNYYKLYSKGWHWENNYSPRNSCATGNNEFSAMTGLFSIYNTCTSNVYKDNTYFEAIFNLFNNKGYTTTSMHDFVEWYYKRKTIHPNMGSGKFYGADTLDIETSSEYGEWPSDEEFFEKAMDIVLKNDDNKPFMTFLTTVTSHQPYSVSSTYGDLYMEEFKEKGYSTTVSRYLSKLKVLDNAIGIMIKKLEAAHKLDDTVIVLLADHYPYALSKNQIKEMLDYELEDYEIERTPFVIYNSSMTPQTFKDYNFYINLVPTLANLMNLEYDPRLYMGSDILSNDYESRVIFADGSWKNEYAYYNASTSKIKYYTDKEYTEDELQEINQKIALKIQMSSNAIKNNYFNYLGQKLLEYEQKDNVVDDKLEE